MLNRNAIVDFYRATRDGFQSFYLIPQIASDLLERSGYFIDDAGLTREMVAAAWVVAQKTYDTHIVPLDKMATVCSTSIDGIRAAEKALVCRYLPTIIGKDTIIAHIKRLPTAKRDEVFRAWECSVYEEVHASDQYAIALHMAGISETLDARLLPSLDRTRSRQVQAVGPAINSQGIVS